MTHATLTLLLLCCCGAAYPQTVKSVADYKAEAEAAVDSVSVRESARLLEADQVVLVDVRDSAEVSKSGTIAGAVHVPRGMLEFYIDPASSMHNEIFNTDKKVVFYCATGGRSLLAAKLASDMGIEDAGYLKGGFRAWSRAGGDTRPVE